MNTRRHLLALALLPAVLVACGGNDSLDDRLDLADPKVRLVHAVPGAPNVSLFRDNGTQPENTHVTNVPYKGASNYFEVSTDSHRWEVKTATTPALPVGEFTFDAVRGHKYTLIAVPNSGSVTEVVMIDDPFARRLTTNDARVRAFNAAFNAPSVDVYLTDSTVDIATVGPTIAAVGYKGAVPPSGANSIGVDGGGYVLRLTTAGTKTVLFTAPVTIDTNADWLLVPVPASVTPNDMRVLVIKADGGAATELTSVP